MAGLLLDAAADARRLGHTHALTAPLLRAVDPRLVAEDHGPTLPPDGWFATALDYATRPLRSDGVRALIPSTTPGRTSAYDAGRLPRTTPHPYPRPYPV